MLVFGVVLGLPGTVLGLPETVAELGLTLTSRGTLISALFVGLLVGCLSVRCGRGRSRLPCVAGVVVGARRDRDAAARDGPNGGAGGDVPSSRLVSRLPV